jgi:hypothetical protein
MKLTESESRPLISTNTKSRISENYKSFKEKYLNPLLLSLLSVKQYLFPMPYRRNQWLAPD